MIDSLTNVQVNGALRNAEVFSVSTIDRSSEYANLLDEFPEITKLQQSLGTMNCDSVHHLITNGCLIAQRARRLCPQKLNIAKEQFREYVKAGICRPSSAPWASPILMKEK